MGCDSPSRPLSRYSGGGLGWGSWGSAESACRKMIRIKIKIRIRNRITSKIKIKSGIEGISDRLSHTP